MRIDTAFQSATQAALAGPELKKLHEATVGFETAMVKQMVSLMGQSGSETIWGKGISGSLVKDSFEQSLADSLVARSPFGLAERMFHGLAPTVIAVKAQQAARAATTTRNIPSNNHENS